ncbi:MAG: hypothetical protein WD096_07180 [Actinomycetota bacterium]
MRRATALIAVICAVILGTVAAAGTMSQDSAGVMRYERAFVNAWHFGCHADACQGGPAPFEPIVLSSPVSEDAVDVVVTVTMDYETTPGDSGILRMHLDPPGSASSAMKPGDFILDSNGARTTTSLSWIARSVPAAGEELEFRLHALPRKGSADGHFHIRGSRFTVVIEIWSSG